MANGFARSDLLAYLRSHRLAVLGSLSANGEPQAALVGVAVTDEFEVVFDTVSTSRKHANLVRDARASITWAGPGEKTAQFEGLAAPVSPTAPEDEPYRRVYFQVWPECLEHLSWANIAYWRIEPRWLRYTDYDAGGVMAELAWPAP